MEPADVGKKRSDSGRVCSRNLLIQGSADRGSGEGNGAGRLTGDGSNLPAKWPHRGSNVGGPIQGKRLVERTLRAGRGALGVAEVGERRGLIGYFADADSRDVLGYIESHRRACLAASGLCNLSDPTVHFGVD